MDAEHPGRIGLVVAALVVVCVTVFVALAHALALRHENSARQAKLVEIAELALRRAEQVADQGRSLVQTVLSERLVDCAPATLHALRLRTIRQSAVKDIRITDGAGATLCSAFEETIVFDMTGRMAPTYFAMPGDPFRLFALDQVMGSSLGVFTEVGRSGGLVAILGLSPEEVDFMPDELEGAYGFSLVLGGSRMIMDVGSPVGDDAIIVRQTSKRFPLSLTIAVEKTAYAGWHVLDHRNTLLISGFIGLLFSAVLTRLLVRPVNPVTRLDRDIARKAFKPWFQPVVDLTSGSVTGAEILCRKIGPDGRVIPPGQFIELAEQSGRIRAITWAILAEAIEDLRDVLAMHPWFRLSVNITPTHFLEPGFAAELTRHVARLDVNPEQIVIELTERDAFPDLEQAAARVREVHARGFKVAIDDVGIGHSGLSQIQALGADVIKIDKFFVDLIGRDMGSRVIVQMLVRLAEEMGVGLVAEGIETEEQKVALVACGVRRAQGYLMARPMPADAFLDHCAGKLANPRAGEAELIAGAA